jgi:hypothetical protein
MNKIQTKDISYLLNEVAKSIDLPDSLFDEAERKYKAVGKWLSEAPSPLAVYSPQIYPQGSFLLGTVTKPADDSDDYDIDLVFELALKKNEVTQKQLKNLVGDRLKENQIYHKMLTPEKRRCWRLQYSDNVQFHQDILPAIPDIDMRLKLRQFGVPQNLSETSLAITDTKDPNYSRVSENWPRSNPKGYAAWFRERMLIQFQEIRESLAVKLKADISNVPDYTIKTPLQRSIQLLKRHRDLMFVDDADDQPASIIITTLAAEAYNNEADLTDALSQIIEGMPQHITCKNDVVWIANPIDPAENFADRWIDNPIRHANFYKWLKQVKSDTEKLLSCDDIDSVLVVLSELFGERVVNSVINRYKDTVLGQFPNGSVIQTPKPAVVPIVHPLKPWGN